MMGIPVESHTYIYGDNQSVLANTTMPHSNLKKKSNAIAFHFVREGTARDEEWRTAYINTHMITHQICWQSHFLQGRKREGSANWFYTTIIERTDVTKTLIGELFYV
jgi:hypothetical protein